MVSLFCKSGSISNNLFFFFLNILQFYIETCKHVFPFKYRLQGTKFYPLCLCYSIIADEGLEYKHPHCLWYSIKADGLEYKHHNLATVNHWLAANQTLLQVLQGQAVKY